MRGREFREGRGSHKEGQAGELADRQTDRQCPGAPAASTRPLRFPENPVPGFVSNPFTLCQVRVVSLGGVGGGQWAEPQTSTDGSRYKAPDIRQQQMQGAVNAEGRTHSDQPCRYQDSTEETALPRGAGWEAPPTAAPGFTGALLYLLEQMYSASFSAFPQVSPSVCRPILFTGKQQHLFVYMVI